MFMTLLCAHCASNRPPPTHQGAASEIRTPAGEVEEPLAEEIEALEALTAQEGNQPEAWQRLGTALRRANRLPEAARASWHRIELGVDWQSWTNLGNVLLQGSARAAAAEAFEHAAATGPA